MAEFPALPLWTDAYLADTRHLSTLEHGAYLLLLMEAWRRPHCDLPDDDRLLARLSGLSLDEWMAIAPVVMELWDRDGRRKTWTQKRLKKERLYVGEKSARQRDNARKRWKGSENDDATALPDGCQTDAPTPTPTPTPTPQSPNGDYTPQPPKQKRKASCPDDFIPIAVPGSKTAIKMEEWSKDHLATQIEKFIAHHQGKGNTSADWNKQWTTWALNDFDRSKQNGNGNRSNTGSGNGLLDATLNEMAERGRVVR